MTGRDFMIGAISETELVAQCKAGDHAAFAELVRQNSSVAMRAICSIVWNPADAEDIMQDTLVNAYKGVAGFNERCKFSTWLTRIAVNNALLYLRRRKHRVEISLDWETDDGDSRTFQVADSGVDPEEALMRHQAVLVVRKAVRALPIRLRQYARRRYFEEVPHEQVAASLGISLAAGKSRSMRARRRLETSLGRALGRTA